MLLGRRLFSTERTQPHLRIGNSIRTIPDGFKTFFESKEIFNEESFGSNLKLTFRLDGEEEKLLLVEGRGEVNKFTDRLRFLLKWGHFVWRVSDLSAVRLEPTRIIKPSNMDSDIINLKIHWQLKVAMSNCPFYIDGKRIKMSLPNLLQVQYHRLFPLFSNHRNNPKDDHILFTGINRYSFDKESGMCRELHVERIEPRIGGIEWKWRIAKGEHKEEAFT